MTELYQNFSIPSDKILGISVDTIFTTFITIFIFIIGYVINKYVENKKEKNRLNKLRDYYIYLVKQYLKPIENFIKSLDELIESISSTQYINIHFTGGKDLYFDKILNISHQDLYIIFVQNISKPEEEKYMHFNNFVNSFEYLKVVTKNTKEEFYKYHDNLNRFIKHWDENINQLGRYFESMMQQIKANNIDPITDNFFHQMDILRSRWVKLENFRNINIAMNNYLNPLNELCDQYPSDSRVLIITPLVANCSSAHKNILNIKQFYSDVFKETNNDLVQIKSQIEKAISFYE